MGWKKICFSVLAAGLLFEPSLVSAGVTYDYHEYKSLIGRYKNANYQSKKQAPFIGIISHHLPTASPLIDNFYYQLKKARPDIKTFVVIGPDHFERCRQKFSVTGASVMTMFGELKVDKNVMKQILDSGAGSEESCFHGEHAIGVQANYIKKFFPRAKIVPVLLSYSAGKRDFAATINELKNDRKDVFVLASVDFTHYMDVQKAESVDAITRRMINGNDGSLISLKQVDSPGTLKVILGLAKSLRLKSEIIEHRNSFYYDGIYKNTTSYFSVLF